MKAEKKMIVGSTLKAKKWSANFSPKTKLEPAQTQLSRDVNAKSSGVEKPVAEGGLQNDCGKRELQEKAAKDDPRADAAFVGTHQPGQADEN